MNQPKLCPICDKPIPRKYYESWPTYYAKTACGVSHAARWRQRNAPCKKVGLTLAEAMSAWV